jgi:hypothetical protein
MMKNNTLAMLATISLVFSVAMLVGYIDPTVCAGSQIQDISTCNQAASEHIIGFACFFTFGAFTLIVGAIRSKFKFQKKS